jgi:hypothetical protein
VAEQQRAARLSDTLARGTAGDGQAEHSMAAGHPQRFRSVRVRVWQGQKSIRYSF